VTSPARRALAVAAFVLLFARSTFAVADPVEAGLLAKIAAALKTVQEVRMRVMDKLQEQVYDRLHAYAFPRLIFDSIRHTTATVVDMRHEIQRLACGWPMSPRTKLLSDLMLKPMSLCRLDYQELWGAHDIFWDRDLQETHDYVATMTANMISERTEKTYTTWTRAHRDLLEGHALYLTSPGEANRAEAAALAWANQVALGNSQVTTQSLLIRQMARDMDRFDEKKSLDLTYYTYKGVATRAGGGWGAPPPDVSEGAVR
jgi:hypothetical protein